MPDQPTIISEITGGIKDIAINAVDTLGNEPANIGKSFATQTGITPPPQTNKQHETIEQLKEEDEVESGRQIDRDREELKKIRIMKQERHEQAQQIGVAKQQPNEDTPTGPPIQKDRELPPLNQGVKPGQTPSSRLVPNVTSADTKRGTRERKGKIAA